MSAPTRAEILQKAADGVLLDALFSEYGRLSVRSGDEVVAALAEAHNDGAVDLLSLVTPEALEPYKGKHVLFSGQHLYRALIGRLQAPVASMLMAVNALIDAAGSDGTAGLPGGDFAKWCAADPTRPVNLLALIEAKVPGAARFLPTALKTGAAVDPKQFLNRAYGFLTSADCTERLGALRALGEIPVTNKTDWARLTNAFEAQLKDSPEDLVRAGLLRAAVNQMKLAPPEAAAGLGAVAKAAVAPLGDFTLAEAAQILAFDLEGLEPSVVDRLLVALEGVNLEHAGTIQTLDFALVTLAEAGSAERVRGFVETLFARDADLKLTRLQSLTGQLLSSGGTILEDWLVAWLRQGNQRLLDELAGELVGPDGEEQVFAIDFARFGLREPEYGYCARKAIGSFFFKPAAMTSMLVSLLRSAPPSAAAELEELLFDPVLINYSGVGSRYLRTVADDTADFAAPAALRALAQLDTYVDGLKAMGPTPELHPSELERHLERQRHGDLMSAAYEKARARSILRSIMSESVMLYGTSSVSWVGGQSATAQRHETPLATFGHSFEMPRIDVVDPLGLQYMLISFRGERRPK